MTVVLVILGIIVIAALVFILTRNSMIGSRNRVDEAWSGIDVQLKRRHDLVPNLVETVNGSTGGDSVTLLVADTVAVANVETLNGTSGADTFTFLTNNTATINGGNGTGATTISLGANGAMIVNNILFNSGAPSGYCVAEYNLGDGEPASLTNNDLFDCGTALYQDWVESGGFYTSVNINSIATINAFSYGSQNVSADPVLVDDTGDPELGNWDLTAGSPDAVKTGGADLTGEGFIGDYNGLPRLGAWSIGAYEY